MANRLQAAMDINADSFSTSCTTTIRVSGVQIRSCRLVSRLQVAMGINAHSCILSYTYPCNHAHPPTCRAALLPSLLVRALSAPMMT